MTNPTPSATTHNEQEDELERLIFEYGPDDLETRLRMIIAYARDGKNQPKDIYVQLILKAVAHHTKEAVERAEAIAKAEGRLDYYYDMQPLLREAGIDFRTKQGKALTDGLWELTALSAAEQKRGVE